MSFGDRGKSTTDFSGGRRKLLSGQAGQHKDAFTADEAIQKSDRVFRELLVLAATKDGLSVEIRSFMAASYLTPGSPCTCSLGQDPRFQIDTLDVQLQGCEQAQAGALEQRGHEARLGAPHATR